jgi:D-citramalate synthase
MRPSTTLSLRIDGNLIEEHAKVTDNLMLYERTGQNLQKQNLSLPKLIDYAVRIPPGSSSDALCETVITWTNNGKEFKTRGLDSDQTVAAIIATQKMLNVE